MVLELRGSITTVPTEYDGSLSNTGVQVVPELVVFHTPPDAAAMNQTCLFRGSTAMSATRPDVAAGPHPDPRIEKYPVRFEIDELRCIVCGFCVEACPKDAIRMDTGTHAPAVLSRPLAVFDKEALLKGPAVEHASDVLTYRVPLRTARPDDER